MSDELFWKLKYDRLQSKIQELHEEGQWVREEQPAECISESEEFYISNSMEVVDNEEYALRNWGEGFYFKVRKDYRMKTYNFEDLKVKINGVDIEASEIPEIDIPGPEITCNGKPLRPLIYLRNTDAIEIVSFDDGETYYCNCQSYDQIFKRINPCEK